MPNPQELIKYYRRYDSANNVWDYVYLVTSAGAVKETTNRIFVHVSENQFKGVYSPTASYELNDIVKYRPNASAEWRYYIAIQNAFVGQDPSTATTYWSPYDLSKEGSASNSGFFSRAQATKLAGISTGANKVLTVDLAPTWVGGTSYSVGNIVKYNNNYYLCSSAVSGSTNPSSDTAHWTQIESTDGGVTIDGIYHRVTPVISTVGGSGYGGVLVKTAQDGKIDTSFIPDSILNSLKYKGTWDASNGYTTPSDGYNPSVGDYWICNNAGNKFPKDTPPLTTFDGSATYKEGDIVYISSSGVTTYYRSLQNNNTGHTPDTSPTYWKELPSPVFQNGDWVICRTTWTMNSSQADAYTSTVWASAADFDAGDIVKYRASSSDPWKVYFAKANSQGQNPTTATEYWEELRVPVWDEIDNETKVVSVNGRTGIVSIYQGAYDSLAQYYVGDIILKDNQLQICVGAGIGPNATFISFSNNKLDVERQYLYSYGDSAGQPTFKRIDGNSKIIETIHTDIGSTVSGQNLYTYLVGTVLNISNNDTSFVENTTKNLTIIANFTFDGDNTLGETGDTRRFSTNFKAFLTSNYSNTNSVPLTNNKIAEINKMRIDFVKEFNSSGILKLTLFDNANREYYIDIKKTYNEGSGNTTYTTRGWRVKNIIEDGSTSNITDALEGDICLEDYSA